MTLPDYAVASTACPGWPDDPLANIWRRSGGLAVPGRRCPYQMRGKNLVSEPVVD